MKVVSKLELKVDNFEKCHLICDNDCALGELYDYVCAAKSFVMAKMKEADETQKSASSEA